MRRGPLKGTVSAQKVLEGSKTETRELLGGTKEKSFPRRGVIDLPSEQFNAISQKRKQKIVEFVARPMGVEVCRGLAHFGADLAFDGPGVFRLQGRRGYCRD